MAYIYAKRIDWMLSGDDNEESLAKRLHEELRPRDWSQAGVTNRERDLDRFPYGREGCANYRGINSADGRPHLFALLPRSFYICISQGTSPAENDA